MISKSVIESDTFACDLDWDVDCSASFLLGNSMHVAWDELHAHLALATTPALLSTMATRPAIVYVCPEVVSLSKVAAGETDACVRAGQTDRLLDGDPLDANLIPAARLLATRGGIDIVLAGSASTQIVPTRMYRIVVQIDGDGEGAGPEVASSVPFLIGTVGCRAADDTPGVCAQRTACETAMGGVFVPNDGAAAKCHAAPWADGSTVPFGCCTGTTFSYSSVLARQGDADEASSIAIALAATAAALCVACLCVGACALTALAVIRRRRGTPLERGPRAAPARRAAEHHHSHRAGSRRTSKARVHRASQSFRQPPLEEHC